MKKRLLSVLLCLTMVAACTTGCGAKTEEPAPEATEEPAPEEEKEEEVEAPEEAPLEKTTIKMALPGGAHTLHEIAVAQGYYEDAGLTVEIVPVENGSSAFTALTSGKVDFLSTFGTNQPLQYIGSGVDLTIFGGYLLEGSMSIIGKAGTEWHGIEDLVGKRIACDASSYYVSGPLLDLGHDPLKDVTWIDGLNRLERLEAVLKDEADYAVMPTLQNWDALNTEGIELMAYCDEVLDNYSCCRMEALTSWLEENPNTAKALLKVWLRAQDYFEAHGEELIPTLAAAAGTEDKYVEAYITSGHYSMKVDPAKSCVIRAWNYLLDMGFFEEGAENINIEDHINTEIYKTALDECQAAYGDSSETPNFYDQCQTMFAELD